MKVLGLPKSTRNMSFLQFCVICLLSVTFGHETDPRGNPAISQDFQAARTLGEPWPQPQQYIKSTSYMIVKTDTFKFISNSQDCSILNKALKRYLQLLFSTKCAASSFQKQVKATKWMDKENLSGYLYNISVKINVCEEWPHMNMDEQYLLKINTADEPGKGLLFANSVWGALRGLETLSHIIYQNSNNEFLINSTFILDYPRFSYRGILLDTSRHFIPVHILLQNLDAMAMNKMNVFHWHIVDDQSFPYVSSRFPDLSEKGAFNPTTHIYSLSDVAHIIQYARERGIRVLPEFDTPGHTQSWGKGQPGLLTSCYDKGVPDGTFGPINPILDSSYKFLSSFFAEVAKLFPDSYIHLGGDEVSFSCWQSNPNITSFMKQHGFVSNYSKLEEYYMTRLVKIVQDLKKSYIVWQEVFDNNVKIKSDTVIHVWKSGQESELQNVTAAGYNALLSTCWYLNYINYGNDWPSYYKCDPQAFNGTAQQKKLVLGGEACMWGEYVDGTNAISRTWPRASAVAERLWSSQSLTSADDAEPRLEEQRCRMMKRGLKVEPVNGPGFCECDHLV